MFSSSLYKRSLGQFKSRFFLCFPAQVLGGSKFGGGGPVCRLVRRLFFCGLVSGLVSADGLVCGVGGVGWVLCSGLCPGQWGVGLAVGRGLWAVGCSVGWAPGLVRGPGC